MLVANGDNAVGTVHFGLDEYSEQAFCAHLLRPGDVFVDVGASDGSYALMASGIAGADTIAFEPEPAAAGRLLDNVVLNRLADRIQIRRSAVGRCTGVVRITTNLRTGNHVVVDGEMISGMVVEVPCVALDTELVGTAPTMIKVDVEGFEQAVLDGGAEVFRRNSLLAVILEDMQLGRHCEDLSGQHRRMLDIGFRSYVYVPEERRLVDLEGKANQGRLNTLYVRNVSQVLERLAEAPAFRIRGRSI
jgi:FkbM family methyltransferase